MDLYRGLFVRHTRTGNPLVDSVAEHQATQDSMYFQYFHVVYYLAPLGFLSLLWRRSESKFFIMVYDLTAMYFSKKMVRLVLILSPVSSVLGGIAVAGLVEWALSQVCALNDLDFNLGRNLVFGYDMTKSHVEQTDDEIVQKVFPELIDKKYKQKSNKNNIKSSQAVEATSSSSPSAVYKQSSGSESELAFRQLYDIKIIRMFRFFLAVCIMHLFMKHTLSFSSHAYKMAARLSSPSILFHARYRDGRTVLIDDFREAYWWLRDNTPEDSRVLSWWDYGYQISQVQM